MKLCVYDIHHIIYLIYIKSNQPNQELYGTRASVLVSDLLVTYLHVKLTLHQRDVADMKLYKSWTYKQGTLLIYILFLGSLTNNNMSTVGKCGQFLDY